MKHDHESTADFQKRTFPKKIKAVRAKANAALKADKKVGKGHKSLSVKQRGVHQDALKAANRIEKRLTNPSGGTTAKTTVHKETNEARGARRRKPIERATGMDKITNPLRAVNELAKARRK